MDTGATADVVSLNFHKVFDKAPHQREHIDTA